MTVYSLQKQVIEDESGAGFLESLIAIIVGGMACIALIGLAVMVIRESKNNEIRDALTYYAAEGMERVRVVAATDYGKIGGTSELGACDGGNVTWGYFVSGSADAPEIISAAGEVRWLPSDLCSSDEGGTACETLSLPSGGEEILYRELTFTDLSGDGSCSLVKVTVEVGMLSNTPTEYARNFVTEITLDGFITR